MLNYILTRSIGMITVKPTKDVIAMVMGMLQMACYSVRAFGRKQQWGDESAIAAAAADEYAGHEE